ncbi:ABC transporter permease [Prauserella coralliicola]|nr:ABC transporter permease [Prauserella coralliicola]
MDAIAPVTPVPAAPPEAGEVDSRAAYVSFGSAFLLGHGAAALSMGAHPVLALPGWLPLTLLGVGVVTGLVLNMRAVARAQRGASESELLAGKLLGASWTTGFIALFLTITGLTAVFDQPDLQNVLWPAGSVLVVGLIYLAEGAVRRNRLHYGLGTWLALIAAASVFLGTPGLYWVLAVGGGGGYAVAALLEGRRLTVEGPQVQS